MIDTTNWPVEIKDNIREFLGLVGYAMFVKNMTLVDMNLLSFDKCVALWDEYLSFIERIERERDING